MKGTDQSRTTRETFCSVGVECYCLTACSTALVFLPVSSNLCRACQTSWMETICLTNESLELVHQMPFMLSPSGISFWTDRLFFSNVPSTEGPFMISAHKESHCIPCLYGDDFFWMKNLFHSTSKYLQNTNCLVYATLISQGCKVALGGTVQTDTEKRICGLCNSANLS